MSQIFTKKEIKYLRKFLKTDLTISNYLQRLNRASKKNKENMLKLIDEYLKTALDDNIIKKIKIFYTEGAKRKIIKSKDVSSVLTTQGIDILLNLIFTIFSMKHQSAHLIR